jgi:hypothetical protein
MSSEDLGYGIPASLRDIPAVLPDGLFAAADLVAKLNGSRDTEVGRVVYSGDKLEQMYKR